MALIELATNHDVNALVEAIRSLKQEDNILLEMTKGFIVPFASAFGGAYSAYLLQSHAVSKSYNVERIVELNSICQELDRLSTMLINLKQKYFAEVTSDPFTRIAATKYFSKDFSPPRLFPTGKTRIKWYFPDERIVSEPTIDTLFSNYSIFISRLENISQIHNAITAQMEINRFLISTEEYCRHLRSVEPANLSPFVLEADYLLNFIDYLLLESYYSIEAILRYCTKKFKTSEIKEADGLFVPSSIASNITPFILSRIPNGDETAYQRIFGLAPVNSFDGSYFPAPTEDEVRSLLDIINPE